jgi:hypothetical protein
MKTISTKKSILSTAALVALVTMSSFTYGTQSEKILCHLGKAFMDAEKILSDFFNASNNTHYKTYVITFDKALSDLETNIEQVTRCAGDIFASEAHDIAEYVRQQFNAFLGVIKKYNGKNASEMANFKADLDLVFHPDTAFGNILKKLNILKTKAVTHNNTELVKKISVLIGLIERKRSEWNAKQPMALLLGLKKRMDCR